MPLPEEEKGSGEEEDEEEEKQPRQGARSFSIPHGSLATVRPGITLSWYCVFVVVMLCTDQGDCRHELF